MEALVGKQPGNGGLGGKFIQLNGGFLLGKRKTSNRITEWSDFPAGQV
jgi:hypothetical protein